MNTIDCNVNARALIDAFKAGCEYADSVKIENDTDGIDAAAEEFYRSVVDPENQPNQYGIILLFKKQQERKNDTMRARINIYIDKNQEFVAGALIPPQGLVENEKVPEGCRRIDCVEIEFDTSLAYIENDEAVGDRFAH